MQEPESTHHVDERVRATKLVQVNLLFGHAMDLRFGACEPVEGIKGARLDRIRRIRLLDHAAQRGHGPFYPVSHGDQHTGARDVAAGLATDLDGDLVAQAQRLHDGVELGAVGATIDERAQRHVA